MREPLPSGSWCSKAPVGHFTRSQGDLNMSQTEGDTEELLNNTAPHGVITIGQRVHGGLSYCFFNLYFKNKGGNVVV